MSTEQARPWAAVHQNDSAAHRVAKAVRRGASESDLLNFALYRTKRTMKTLDYYVRTRQDESSNNFLVLRLLAATMVVYGHSYALAAVTCASCQDLVKALTHYRPSQTLGVNMFFVISGFLVVGSYANRNNLVSYLRSRALRIFPGLVICAALTAFIVGSAATSLSLREYFGSWEPLHYFAVNASLYSTVYELPGVGFSSTPYGTAVNGSLWTIPIEARLYLLVAVAGACGLVRGRWSANLALLALIAAAFQVPSQLPLIPAAPGPYRVAAFFAVGAFAYVNRSAIPVDWRLLALLVAVTALSSELPSFELLCAVCLVYGIFCVAYAPKLPLPRWVQDYSYGIYLYSFPIQQVFAKLFPGSGPYKMMAIAIPVSWLAGALSWHLVEKPMLRLKAGRSAGPDANADMSASGLGAASR